MSLYSTMAATGSSVSRRLSRAQMLAVAAIVASILTSGCAVEWTRDHPLYCRMDEQRLIRDTLYFGRSIPGGGEVGDADWKRFESDVLARAFPKGFTVLDSHGAWRGASGDLTTERGQLVIVLHGEEAASDAAVKETIARYRAMFRQKAVLRERSTACITFG